MGGDSEEDYFILPPPALEDARKRREARKDRDRVAKATAGAPGGVMYSLNPPPKPPSKTIKSLDMILPNLMDAKSGGI